ncbi:unnamed protein product [Fusarium venenatum]|uniref:Zn(2)-C6 fungal-type domain-containing protein n=1 Tax=Fusarium venenatum TaxID=56646 RepID=A0A2L2T6K3_9HYPO|nr:uncharacterized protein FVRRES_07829 [Fusarium venenatum]CEI63393.1 unnamed protein product [Fusarium venenatum]
MSASAKPVESVIVESITWGKSTGDLGQPICSRCSDRGETCIYSTIRRSPGPGPWTGRTKQTLQALREAREARVVQDLHDPQGASDGTVQLLYNGDVSVTDTPSLTVSSAAPASGISPESATNETNALRFFGSTGLESCNYWVFNISPEEEAYL